MKIPALLGLWLVVLSCNTKNQKTESSSSTGQKLPKAVLVIHGGAGSMTRERMNSETENTYRAKLEEALRAGYEVLNSGGESCEAVLRAIQVMENSPLFNAGAGAVATEHREHELDASIMRGRDRNAGAVAAVKTIKNPILAAYEVMQNSPHVMMTGAGAEQFASGRNLEMVSPDYFKTERREAQQDKTQRIKKAHGTVGAAALDDEGNLCAGTSTGGMAGKKRGRVGDSPIIGAGTYANNATCGVSATGHGEYFIRAVSAYDVAALMDYKAYNVDEAASIVVKKTEELGGAGGLIALDAEGNVSMPFSTASMYRGYVTKEGELVVKIFKDE